MPRSPRKTSSSSIYHVISRGSSHQIIFEDDADRAFFMKKLEECLKESDGQLLCWCLMSNHFHLLLKAKNDSLSHIMHKLLTTYAGYFNRVHERSGALFEGRFKSEPVETDQYLLEVVRYIHNNPFKANLSASLSYPWSSYDEYVNGENERTDTKYVIDVFGGLKQFEDFHVVKCTDKGVMDTPKPARRFLSDEKALAAAMALLSGSDPANLKSKDRNVRDAKIAELKEAGLSTRQIQRITGVSLGTISKVKRGQSKKD